MLYVKANLNEDCDIKIAITDENVFTHCSLCGKELKVDIEALLKDGDLLGTKIYCEKCGFNKII